MESPAGSLQGIKAAVFDVFGTLVEITDQRRPYAKLLRLLEGKGRLPQEGDAAQLMSTPVGLAGVANLFGVELFASDLAPLEHDLLAELASVRLYPDTVRTLTCLREKGIKIGVCSNLAAPYAIPVEKLLPFSLDAYAWSFEIGAIKPNPTIYRAACAALKCAPQETLFVGDTLLADYIGPRKIGMRSLHLVRNAPSTEEDSISSLDDILLGFPPAPGAKPLQAPQNSVIRFDDPMTPIDEDGWSR